MKNEVNRTLVVKKTMNNTIINSIMKTKQYIALVLMVLGLSVGTQVFAAGMVLEATGFQAVKAPDNTTNTNNTWDAGYASGGTYGSCSTTANNVTISSSFMTINTTNFAVQDTKSFTVTAASGTYIYRIVFKPKTTGVGGSQTALTKSNGVWSGSDTWQCAENYWGFTKGKSSVTFTDNCGLNFEFYSINVYTYRTATSAEASLSQTTFNVSAGTETTAVTRLTTSLGPFAGANTPYYNQVDATGISTSDLDFDYSGWSSTISNNNNLSFT